MEAEGEVRRRDLEMQAAGELRLLEPLISRAVGLPSNWSGEVAIDPVLKDNGVKHWDCGISLSPSLMERDDRYRTLIHELLHAHSVGFIKRPFSDNRGWDEGVVEQLQRLIRPRILAEAGLTDSTLYGDAIDRKHLYNIYIVALEKIRGLFGDEAETFYLRLLALPIEQRAFYVMRRAAALRASQPLRFARVVEECSKAGATLILDLNVLNTINSAKYAPLIEDSTSFLFDGKEQQNDGQ